jgi:potassium efflux system protein
LTAAAIEARIAALKDATGLAEGARATAVDLLNQALAAIAKEAQWAARSAQLRKEAAEAPGLLDRIKQELARPAEEAAPTVPAELSLAQAEQSQAEAVAELQAARTQLDELQAESPRRQTRRAEIPGQIAQGKQRLAELEQSGTTPPDATEPAQVSEARAVLREVQARASRAEIESLEAELANYEARRELLPARRDLALRRVATLEKRLAAWQGIVSAERQREAEAAAKEAERLRRQAARQHPVLRDYAQESQRLAEERTKPGSVPQRITAAAALASDARARLAQLRKDYASVKARIDASGLSKATGLLLRRQYESLPDLTSLRRTIRETQRQIEDAEYELIERQDARIGAGDVDAAARELLAGIESTGEAQSRSDLEAVAIELVGARRDLLNQLVSDAATLFEELVELDGAAVEYLSAAEAYEGFISERILWVRSMAADRAPNLSDLRETVAALGSSRLWTEGARAAWEEVRRRWPLDGFRVAALLGLILAAPYAAARVRRHSELVSRFRTDAFRHTLAAAVFTLLAALPVPALVWWAGAVLSAPASAHTLVPSLGSGLIASVPALYILLFLRGLLRPMGLAEVHFKWPKALVQAIRVHLLWFLPLISPMLIVTAWMATLDNEAANATVGRSAFTLGMLTLVVFLQRVLRFVGPGGEPAGDAVSWAARLKPLWLGVVLASPVALAVLAWLGYYYSALQLSVMMRQTIALLIAVAVLNAILTRWLFVARRRVAVEDARRRREQAIKEDAAGSPAGATESSLPPIDEDKVNLPGLSAQATQLFRTATAVIIIAALAGIWGDALPALRMLDRVQVWPSVRVIEDEKDNSVALLEPGAARGAASDAGGGAPPAPTASTGAAAAESPGMGLPMPDTGAVGGEAAPLALSLADLGLAVIFLIGTWVAFRNLPGLIEMIVLQRLPLDAASRYALSTVIRYAIVIIGVSTALGVIGISWSNIQWLAAALTFGLAFGLQEIFANFISGLIILAERPIRIGDTVTIGQVSGTVTRVRMRATTITDWDRKELIIPNKNFITGDVINWTLTDPVLRLVIPIGVAYSSDVGVVEKTLLRVAEQATGILRDPAPNVQFLRFGDSTLDFELRVFLPTIEALLPVRHALNKAIIAAFRDADIEIAFPQRDLHLRSADGLADLIREAKGGQEAARAVEARS